MYFPLSTHIHIIPLLNDLVQICFPFGITREGRSRKCLIKNNDKFLFQLHTAKWNIFHRLGNVSRCCWTSVPIAFSEPASEET